MQTEMGKRRNGVRRPRPGRVDLSLGISLGQKPLIDIFLFIFITVASFLGTNSFILYTATRSHRFYKKNPKKRGN